MLVVLDLFEAKYRININVKRKWTQKNTKPYIFVNMIQTSAEVKLFFQLNKAHILGCLHIICMNL